MIGEDRSRWAYSDAHYASWAYALYACISTAYEQLAARRANDRCRRDPAYRAAAHRAARD